MKKKAFKAAFPYTIPIGIGFLFLGMSYGFMMQSKGFSVWYPFFMSMFIFAGSMEFVTSNLLLSAFSPVAAFFLALMVNARHLFYGLSMLDKYKNTGWKKFYLIFGMCDESFTVNCTVTPPDDVDHGWFMFFVNLLNQVYWVAAATAGALLGYVIHFDTTGIEFVMIALFVVMFLNQWEETKDHRPALVGLICPVICLLVFRRWHLSSSVLPRNAKSARKRWRQRRNDDDNDTGNHYNRSSCSWNNGDTFYTFYHLSGRKKSTGVCQISGDGSSLCGNRSSCDLLPQGCAGEQYSRAPRGNRE